MWTLVIFAFINGHGVALDHIDNFKTLAACQSAGAFIQKNFNIGYGSDVKLVCIPKES